MKDTIRLYNWQEDEAMMLKLWYDAAKDGTLERVFGKNAIHLSNFLNYVRNCTCAIAHDDNGIWFIIITEPIFDSALVGMWVREDKRKSPAVGRLALEAHKQIFMVAQSCVCYTRDLEKVALFEHFGYTPCGKLTGIWNGEDVYILEMTNGRKRFNVGREVPIGTDALS